MRGRAPGLALRKDLEAGSAAARPGVVRNTSETHYGQFDCVIPRDIIVDPL